MGMRLDKMRTEWARVKVRAFEQNWAEVRAHPHRLVHCLLDVFTESFRHGPYWSAHVYVPLWLIGSVQTAFVCYHLGAGDTEVALAILILPYTFLLFGLAGHEAMKRLRG